MKTVTGTVNIAKPISLSKAATLLSGFVSSETQASQDVSAYLRRASAAFTELKNVHREIRSKNPKSELEELVGAKGIDDLVEKETVRGEESVHGRKQDKKKKRKEMKKEDVAEEKVMVNLEDEQRNKERKKKSKKKDVIDENGNEKLEEERKEKKKKRKLSKEIDA